MPVVPYDALAQGPSQGSAIDQLTYQNNLKRSDNTADYGMAKTRLKDDYKGTIQPGLESTLGATGQFYSSAARKAEGTAELGYKRAGYDLWRSFDRAQKDMKRQEVFAAMGLIL